MSKRGILTAVFGNTGSGKGVWVIHRQIARKKIALVWDMKGEKSEYTGSAVNRPPQEKIRAYNMRDLRVCVAKVKRGIICYTDRGAGADDLSEFCKIAAGFTVMHGPEGHVVIDETSSVTNPGKAAGAYGDLIRMGLSKGCDIDVMCQRGQESDKTAIENASRFHFAQVSRGNDARYISDKSGVPLAVIEGMFFDHDKKKFDYIDVVRNQYYQRGRLSFSGQKPVFKDIGTKIKL